MGNLIVMIIKSEGLDNKKFSIAANKEAFRILSDGLYSDKISAVIRELSTNAIDSHIQAGTDKKFEVHLPSIDESYFSVRDFGVGLSHEDVIGLYSTYFDTNKANDNATTGQLGLGSKSPLSKSDSFTVISTYNGVKKHYIVSINDEGIPEVNYIPSQDIKTDEYNGLCVKVSVLIPDIAHYIKKAQKIYSIFEEKYQPKILNCPDFKLEKKETLFFGDGWKIEEWSYCYDATNGPMAIQGNIAYPISKENVIGLSSQQNKVLSTNIRIKFNNGNLSFTPSREHLSYDKKTIENIRSRCDEIIDNLTVNAQAEINKCKSLWEARVKKSTMLSAMKGSAALVDERSLSWKKTSLETTYVGLEKHIIKFYMKHGNKNPSNIYCNRIYPSKNVLWYEEDLKTGNYVRCRDMVRGTDEIVYLLKFSNSKEKRNFCRNVGISAKDIKQTSSIPRDKKKKGKSNTSHIRKFKSKSSTSNWGGCCWWDEKTEVDEDEGGFYVKTNLNDVVSKNRWLNCRQFNNIVKAINVIDKKTDIVIYGVRPKYHKKFENNKKWVDFVEYAQKKIKRETSKEEFKKVLKYKNTLSDLSDSHFWTQLSNIKELTEIDDSLKLLSEEIEKAKKAIKLDKKKYSIIRSVCGYINTLPKIEGKNLATITENVIARFPLIDFIKNNVSSHVEKPIKKEVEKEIIDYIKGKIKA